MLVSFWHCISDFLWPVVKSLHFRNPNGSCAMFLSEWQDKCEWIQLGLSDILPIIGALVAWYRTWIDQWMGWCQWTAGIRVVTLEGRMGTIQVLPDRTIHQAHNSLCAVFAKNRNVWIFVKGYEGRMSRFVPVWVLSDFVEFVPG